MRPPDIDTLSALVQAGDAGQSVESFTRVRALTSGTGAFTADTFAALPPGGATGDLYFVTDRGWLYYYTGTAWKYVSGIMTGTNAVRAAIIVSPNDDGAQFFTTDTGLRWRVSGGAWVNDPVQPKDSPNVATGYHVGGVKVVGAQGAAITSPAGGATVDAEARTAIDAIRARLTAHGLTL